MQAICFSKYSGCGNDFVVIDNRRLKLSPHREWIKRICHRQHGIGADGVILHDVVAPGHFCMRIFNADGSEAEMCGNGIRCVAHDLYLETGLDSFTIESMLRKHKASIDLNSITPNFGLVTVEMGTCPEAIQSHFVQLDNKSFEIHYLDTGVPHVVLFVDAIESESLMSIAPQIRHHKKFQPRGTNVNFAKVHGGKVELRTYERGVEAETLACGTGATAVALAAAAAHNLTSPVAVRTRSGDDLIIHFTGKATIPDQLLMTGPAVRVFEGVITLDGKHDNL